MKTSLQKKCTLFVICQLDTLNPKREWLSYFVRSRRFKPCAVLTCSGVESAATLCKLRHRDAHLALDTLSDQDSSSSASSCCLLAQTPELNRRIIHRDRLVAAALLVASILSGERAGAVEQEDALGTNLMERPVELELYSHGRSYEI